MPKYIDADKLVDDLRKYHRSRKNYGKSYETISREIYSIISKQSYADVEPVRHGRWVQSDLDKDFVTCSECKRMKLQNRMAWNLNTAEHWGLHYCPNCGAKMRGPEGGENADK